jgi:hypothetical protein
LAEELERAARRRGVSRNRLIVEACRSILGQGAREWPDGFFAPERLSRGDRAVLRRSFHEWSDRIRAARRSKNAPF